MKTIILTALAVLATPAVALAQLPRDAHPGDNGIAADIVGERHRTIFDDLRDTAPRSLFDQLRDSAPNTPFDQLRDQVP